ncbi:hypothetical protein WDU94_012627 [Cyamophila willieti]
MNFKDVDEGCGVGSSSYETCSTLACEATSQKLLLDMNPTIEPCRDFYQYACDHYDVAKIQNEYFDPAHLSLTTLHKFIRQSAERFTVQKQTFGRIQKVGRIFPKLRKLQR